MRISKLKTFFYVLIISITTNLSIDAQWYLQNPVSDNLSSIYFVDSNTGWAVGSGGRVLHTNDGGIMWTSQPSGTIGFLTSVHFVNENIGWIVGGGIILNTTDGGETWMEQVSGSVSWLYSVYFIDANTGWAVGNDESDVAIILKTTNGGDTWSSQSFQSIWSLLSVYFLDANNGWSVGIFGEILHTNNGGTTWTSQASGINANLTSVCFTDANFGTIVGGNGTILRTTDGGTTWTFQSSGTASDLKSVHFVNVNTGWIVGHGATILNTNDGGTTWIPQSSPTSYSLLSVHFIDTNSGWAAGWNGTILNTVNGGLPVEFTSFSATFLQHENTIKLNWITATETNNQGFEVQRSKDGSFETIGFVEGHGTTTETQAYYFTDKNVVTGKYKYRLKQIDFDGSFGYSNVIEVELTSPTTFSLEQNYPNPFNPSTTIKYSIPFSEFVTLKVYDVLGNEVAALVNEEKQEGSYEVEFSANGLTSGIYFYKLKAGSFVETKKMILMK